MAVYERTYRRYAGELTPEGSRFLILPRYAYQEVFKSKLFIAFLALCAVPLLGEAGILYLRHNLAVLEQLAFLRPVLEQIPVNAYFFERHVAVQTAFAFFLVLVVGPGLISPDLRNNGLPLYLARPFSRAEYVLGKLCVLVILLSAITWVPGLLLFALQGFLEGTSWVAGNLRILGALLASYWSWILVFSLLTLAISAWVKWKPVARLALLAIVFVLPGWGAAMNAMLDTRWGYIFNLTALLDTVRAALFGEPSPTDLPVWSAVATLALATALSLYLLSRRVRAYEVVR